MFLGHFAVAYGAKRLAPRISLGTLFAAAQLPDILWPWLLIAGVEQATIVPGDTAVTPLRFDSYPVSHSLVTVAAWGALFGALHFWRRRRVRDAVLLVLLTVSHWLLDFVSHRADMPLWPGGPRLGLELWRSVPLTVLVELLLACETVLHSQNIILLSLELCLSRPQGSLVAHELHFGV